MKALRHIALVGILSSAALPLFAADGWLIVQKITIAGSARITQVQIEKDRMRTDTTGPNGEKMASIFDGQTLTTINLDRKTYTVMTKADIASMGAQASDAMTRMQEQMASLPPAQRAQMEAMMRGRMAGPGMGPNAPPKPQYRKTGSDKVGAWTCDAYEGTVNGEKVSEVCAVAPSALGFAAQDWDITRQLGEFLKTLAPQGQEQAFGVGTVEAQGYSGVPIRMNSYRNGQLQFSSELQQVSRQSFPAASYAVPAGFQKQDSPLGAPARGRGRGTP